jgi:hypothetical protein
MTLWLWINKVIATFFYKISYKKMTRHTHVCYSVDKMTFFIHFLYDGFSRRNTFETIFAIDPLKNWQNLIFQIILFVNKIFIR